LLENEPRGKWKRGLNFGDSNEKSHSFIHSFIHSFLPTHRALCLKFELCRQYWLWSEAKETIKIDWIYLSILRITKLQLSRSKIEIVGSDMVEQPSEFNSRMRVELTYAFECRYFAAELIEQRFILLLE
jgi:hypothetical protein